MENSLVTLLLLVLFISSSLDHLPFTADAISGCNDHCGNLNDCEGNLICIDGKCGDDPDIGSNKCGDDDGEHRTRRSGKNKRKNKKPQKKHSSKHNNGDDDDGGSCKPHYSTMGCGGHKTYSCSPPITSDTKATLTVNSFEKGGDGGDPSECDGKYHKDDTLVVALSTGWYNGGSRCGKKIRISANGKTVEAKVVDECDSMRGCDHAHAGQPPCNNNIVDGSKAVWKALGLDTDRGEVPVTWRMA